MSWWRHLAWLCQIKRSVFIFVRDDLAVLTRQLIIHFIFNPCTPPNDPT